MAEYRVRPEQTEDVAQVRDVHTAAFGRDAEARLVDRLRDDGLVIVSTVAVAEPGVVGNAVFSSIRLRSMMNEVSAAALAPVAVSPAYQRRGIGAALIAQGLRACKERGVAAVFVLGNPEYYRRFGFSSMLAASVASKYSTAGDAWMALELQPDALRVPGLRATYPAAFALVD